MNDLPYRLDRTLVIKARPATVFAFLTETPRWETWWGTGSRIDPRPGGEMLIRHPNGIEASGTVLEVVPHERIVFTYGYPSGPASPPGSSRVTVRLDPHPLGTLLQLTHEFATEPARDDHVQGWRYQLSLFANAIANAGSVAAEAAIDRWFVAWNDPDADTRNRDLDSVVAPAVTFADRFSRTDGVEDLRAQLAAVHRFMPGMRVTRQGPVRYCQWHALADWVTVGPDGIERSRGTNLFMFDADGRIAAAIGFWSGQ
jgi:uncharacterized protein YndB with AHSA1/START domain